MVAGGDGTQSRRCPELIWEIPVESIPGMKGWLESKITNTVSTHQLSGAVIHGDGAT